MIFTTARLQARALTADDAENCFSVYGDPEVMRFITSDGEPAPDVSIVRYLLESGMLAPQPDPRFGFFALERTSDGEFIGTVALTAVEDSPDEYEVGWHLARRHWGNGYATEAGTALLEWGLSTLALDQVLALVRPGNDRSVRVCETLGMRAAGTRMTQGSEHLCFVADRSEDGIACEKA